MKKVNKIKIFNKEYILKFIDLPMSYFEILRQHQFIRFLRKNDILTPKIYLNVFLSAFKVELQEYIFESKRKKTEEKMIVSLAKFHDVSYLYGEKYTKKAYYNVKYKCNGIELNKILLGFKEKYYLYPIAKVDRNDIKELYDLLYSEFILYYYNEDCIIHNDVSINNMYFHNEDVCIIDFDFSTKGSIYVDFVDLIIKRTYSISDIVEYLLETNNLEKYIDIYNSNSIKFHLEYKGCLLMIGLKVLAYNYYVLSEVDSKDLFDKKMLEIKKLLELLKGRYYGN